MAQHFSMLLLLLYIYFFCSVAHTKAWNRFQAYVAVRVCAYSEYNIMYFIHRQFRHWESSKWRDQFRGQKKEEASKIGFVCSTFDNIKIVHNRYFHSKLADLRLTGLSMAVPSFSFFLPHFFSSFIRTYVLFWSPTHWFFFIESVASFIWESSFYFRRLCYYIVFVLFHLCT